MRYYYNTRPPINEVGGVSFNLGASSPLTEAGTLEAEMFLTPLEEAWKNPYLTGQECRSTSTSKYGAKVAWNKIYGTNLRVNLVYMNDQVHNDETGELIPELERDGNIFALSTNYSFYISKGMELRPRLTVKKGAYSGEANGF